MDGRYYYVLFVLITSLLTHDISMEQTSIETDASALLYMKAHITSDPLQILSKNWSSAHPSSSVCSWIGVRCGSLRRRVTALNVSGMGLTGTIPPHLGNLSFLVSLDMTANSFHGNLPPELSRLRRIRSIRLGSNNFSGFVPEQLCNLELLQTLAFESNHLQGVIPRELGNLRNLRELTVQRNQFMGLIPKELGNLTMLTVLVMGENILTGGIPEELSNLRKLERIGAAYNHLSGPIPAGIFNLSKLSNVEFVVNDLSGNLPSNLGFQLPELKILNLAANNIGGVVPDSIVNSSKLNFLSLTENQFTGPIPKHLGNLELLERLDFSQNHFINDPSSKELDFLTSLTNCKSLKFLHLFNNPLKGTLPYSVGNLSKSLLKFNLERANVIGTIPSGIGNLSSLTVLSLAGNRLDGDIPGSIQNLENLQKLSLANNTLRGTLDHFCNMRKLVELYLSHNSILGSVPDCLGNMNSLRILYLNHNLLASSIPPSFWRLKDLTVLDLASNFLNGSLALDVGSLKAVISMDLSTNQISGVIPNSMGSLSDLQSLSLSNNRFNGSIPDTMGNMLSLTSMNLSHNNLSGLIPKSLEALRYLQVFDISSNHLRGEIPLGGPFRNFSNGSFIFNDALCGDVKFQVPRCKTNGRHRLSRKMVLIITWIPLLSVALAVLTSVYVFWKWQKVRKGPSATNVSAPVRIERISYYQLLHATSGYDDTNLLGTGSFGSVYKGELNDGRLVAVKVFHLQFSKAFKSFDVECRVFRNVRHRNIVKVISSCSNDDFKALVLQYMSNGSLDKWLHSHNLFLNITQRLNIMIDVASALHYLHHEYDTLVIHCDLKPSNVLLDQDMVACVSDFGIAKMLGEEESMLVTNTLATIGYIAPEYGLEGLISRSCDVYSYGIMLMEVFTGRRPDDEMFGGNLNLKSLVNDSMPDSIMGVIETNLLNKNEIYFAEKLECVSSIMQLALSCVCESSSGRPSMKEVLPILGKVKLKLLQCT